MTNEQFEEKHGRVSPEASGKVDSNQPLTAEQAYSRLEHLYEISKCLTKFETIEKTFPKVLGLAAGAFPFLSVVLIEKRGSGHSTVSWPTSGLSHEQGVRAVEKARASFNYLVRSSPAEVADLQKDSVITIPLLGEQFTIQTKKDEAANIFTFPLVVDRDPIFGILQIEGSRLLSEADLRFADTLANLISVALDRYQVIQNERFAQEQLQLALESAHMGTWQVDLKTNQLTISKAASDLFNLPQMSGGVSEAIHQIVHPEDRENMSRIWQETVSSQIPYFNEYRIVRKDGSLRWICGQGTPTIGNDGVASCFSGVIYDITDRVMTRKRLEVVAKELGRSKVEAEQAKQEAERANSTKSEFLANMSHEIRTPVTAVMGFAWLLRDANLSKNEIEKYLSVIDRNSNHLLHIIDDILDLSKVEAGKMVIEKIEFSLAEFLAHFSSLMGKKARDSGVQFEFNIQSGIPEFVISDPTRLRQILSNIVGNAIKFSNRGKVELNVLFQGPSLRLRVRDYGRGISQEQRLVLFQPFTQADSSTTRKFGGTGLGLVLAKKLCKAFGGDLNLIDSEIGKGSTFEAHVHVEVPPVTKLLTAQEIALMPLVHADKELFDLNLQGLRILLVEDSPDNQFLIKRILEKNNAQVTLAIDGVEGVEKAMANPYDVILMDIQMPRMDGHEAARALRAKGYSRPIVALTAHAMKEERERTKLSGFSDFLSKPIDRRNLFALLSRLLADKVSPG